jgi:predicted transposase/invertase (TIGR01784 family)
MPKKNQNIENQQGGRYINPFTDFGFKKIFGEEPNKDLLIDFLNELLREQHVHIQKLDYKKTEHLGASDIDRKVVFDLYCENENGEKFIIEMQKAKQTFFKDRTLYYSTFPIQEQAIKGREWNYELKAVFAVALLDFTFDDDAKNNTFVNRIQMIDKENCTVFYDKLTYVFIQIPNFNKSIDELENRLDQWLYVLKNLDKFERIPEKIKDKIFQKIFKIAEYQSLNKDERQAYEDSLKYYRDLKNSLDTAELDGYNKAEKELIPLLKAAEAEIVKERNEKETAQNQAKEAMIKLVKLLNKSGFSIEDIQKETGLSIEEIKKIVK